MRIAIPCLYAEYGRYIDKLRAIPYHIDCLKPVERRLLVSLNIIAPTKLQKSAKVVGHCIGNFHPHGDMSTYGALVQLVKRKWVDGQGNFGAPGLEDSSPAAQRYTEVKLNTYVKESIFEYIKYVPWAVLELDNEPLYLPSIVPIGLIGNGLTQGIGFHTVKMPQYEYSDLIKRLYWLLTKTQSAPIIEPKIANCRIAEVSIGDYERLLVAGQGSIWVCPKYKVYDTVIDVYGKNPINGLSRLRKAAKTYSDMIALKDLSRSTLCVRVFCRIGKVGAQFEEGVVSYISTKINFVCNVVNDKGTIENRSIDSLILGSYIAWKQAWLNKIEHTLDTLRNKRTQLTIIQAIRDCYSPLHTTVDDIVNEFKKRSQSYPNITTSDVKSTISKGRIKELIEAKLDIAAIDRTIKQVEIDISNHDINALNRVKQIM